MRLRKEVWIRPSTLYGTKLMVIFGRTVFLGGKLNGEAQQPQRKSPKSAVFLFYVIHRRCLPVSLLPPEHRYQAWYFSFSFCERMDHNHLTIKTFMAIMAERDAAIQERNLALDERKRAFAERDMAMLQRDAALAERNSAMQQRDEAISTLRFQISTTPVTTPTTQQDLHHHMFEITPTTQQTHHMLEFPENPKPKGVRVLKGGRRRGESVKMEWKDEMAVPVCSCTGVAQPCYRWGSGGWQSACCTTTMSMYPLPQVSNKKYSRIGGRKMSGGAFSKLLTRLSEEGYDFSTPLDLKEHWAKHGTNRYTTVK
ncbi:hypothetical protein LXL04_024646 [Taraxacum kok-saghyz]